MKKIILFLMLFAPIFTYSQARIQMQKENGVYKIPCKVNGLRMKFIFDTGASDVCISLTEATFMYENDYITDDDIIGTSSSQIADGSIVENIRIRLKEIEIAGLKLRNVEALVTQNFGAPLLLGQSVIQKLGAIQIQGNELIILEHQSMKSDIEFDNLFEEARLLYDKKLYTAAAKKYQELYELNALSDFGIYLLAKCYYYSDNYKQAIHYLLKIKDFIDIDKERYHDILGFCYSGIQDFDNAIYHYELMSVYEKDATALFGSKHQIAQMYIFKKDYYKAERLFAELIDQYSEEYYKKTGKNIGALYCEKQMYDERLEEYLYKAIFCRCMQDYSNIGAMKNLAKIGNKYAKEFLKDHYISY